MKSHNGVNKFKRSLLYTGITLGLMSTPFYASAQQDAVEEVVVTGSFIRRSEGILAASPITQLTAEDITAQGTLNMNQIVQNMTFNAGTGVTGGIQASGGSSNSGNFNLRGLGTRATLQLVDGKRTTNWNVQTLIPNIAIQRIDIVTDGAAALYGTDAVAGVVNMLPYKSYDGFKMEHFNEVDSRGDFRDQTTSFLWGTELGTDVDLVVAGAYRHNGTLKWTDRPSLALAGLTDNNGGNPTNWNVPNRDDDGALIPGSTSSTMDPSCGSDPITDPMVEGGNKFGTPAFGTCWFPFADTRDFLNRKDQFNFYSNLTWTASEDLTLSAQVLFGRSKTQGRANQGNPGTRASELPDIRGELPGNPFRAHSGDGRDLFAMPRLDASGAIVTDAYGQPQPMRDANGVVMLAANQFADLTNNPNGGVPFNEDMTFATAYLPFGLANTLPSAFGTDNLNEESSDTRDGRLSFTADFTVPGVDGWEGTSTYMYSQNNRVSPYTQAFSFSATEQGLNCDPVNDATSCFNPFGATDPRFLNSQHVVDAIYTHDRIDDTDILQTFDFIVNGTISPGGFELPGGPIGAAFGYQRRDEVDDNVPTEHEQQNDRLNSTAAFKSHHSRTSDSYFAEFAFPVLSNLELSASVRDEQFSSGQGDVVTKFGAIYTPVDWLALRGTWGEAFIVPTLSQLHANPSCGLSNVDDLFTTFSGFITSCSSGNSTLTSETSESFSLGFDLTPIDGLDIHLSYSETDFENRIVNTTTQDILRTDFKKFQDTTGYVTTDENPLPSLEQLRAWIASPLSDKRIERDPRDITTTTRINRSNNNASTMLVKAWDLQANYSFTLDDIGLGSLGNWGDFRVGLQVTQVDSYEWQESILTPVREAMGNQNNSFGAVPIIPNYRANLSMGWSMGNHSVSTTTRYIDEVNFDANEFSFQQYIRAEHNFRSNAGGVIDAWTQMDMFYAYRDLEVMNGSASLSLGARNVFDREAQKTGMIGGAVTQLQSVLGRVLYARVTYEF